MQNRGITPHVTRRSTSKPAPETAILFEDGSTDPRDAIAAYFGQWPEDVTVSIYKVTGERGTERSYLFHFGLRDAPGIEDLYAQILDRCGPGTYEMLGRTAEDGRIAGRARFSVGDVRARGRVVPDPEPASPAPASAPAPALGELAAAMAEQNRMLAQLVQSIAARPVPEPRDTLSIARELAALKDLFAPAPIAPPAPTSDLLAIVRDVMQIRDQLGGAERDDSPLTAAVRTFGPAIQRAVERLSEGHAASPAPAVPPGQAPSATAPADPPNGNGHMGLNLKAQFEPLVALAKMQRPPEAAARDVFTHLAMLPVWLEQMVLDMLAEEGEGAADRLIQIEPALTAHREWLVQVLRAAVALLDADGAQPAAGAEGVDVPASP